MKRDFELMPEGTVDLEGALNEKFACGGVAAHCRDGKHGGTLDADRIKVVDGLGLFHRPFGRLRIGQHVPVGIALDSGGLGGTHFAVAAAKHLPAEAGSDDDASHKRQDDSADFIDSHDDFYNLKYSCFFAKPAVRERPSAPVKLQPRRS